MHLLARWEEYLRAALISLTFDFTFNSPLESPDVANVGIFTQVGSKQVMEYSHNPRSTERHDLRIPASCPFTISKIPGSHDNALSAWLIREHDKYGEYPHISAKLCEAPSSSEADTKARVIVLSDTGCGTDVRNSDSGRRLCSREQPRSWNILTFLEYTINPNGRIPYLVITTHCHYDHILGLYKLPPTEGTVRLKNDCFYSGKLVRPPIQVLSSAKGIFFVTPYSNLQKHSLCSTIGLKAPEYTVSTWAYDFMKVDYVARSGLESDGQTSITIPTSLTIIHTQGHTPDSLSWYDSDLRLICVGDSFYTKESAQTRKAPWGPEPPMPTIFDLESDLASWWGSMGKILGFVREKNQDLEREAEEENDFVVVNTLGCQDEQPSQPNPMESTFQPGRDTEPWELIDKLPSPPTTEPPDRVRLCAAHTTFGLDAEDAILEMKKFMAAILRDKVPTKRAEHGSTGEERWLWDYALEKGSQMKCNYSVLAPLSIIERGRQTIPKEQWVT